MPRTPVQPAAQFDLPGQSPGQPRQIREHRCVTSSARCVSPLTSRTAVE
jgi:hypothetical protein